jgi:hypothetical protein
MNIKAKPYNLLIGTGLLLLGQLLFVINLVIGILRHKR